MKAKAIPTTTIQDGAGTKSCAAAREPAFTLAELTHSVAASTPSILALGNHLADVERAYDGFDNSKPSDGEENLRCTAAMEILDQRREVLWQLIATMPALSLQDAAVQIKVASIEASRLRENTFDTDTVSTMAANIERMLLAMLPIVAKCADLDMRVMCWDDGDWLRVHRFAGVGVAA